MKTYYYTFCALFALVICGCSKSESDIDSNGGGENISVAAEYVTLLSRDGMLRPQLLNADAELITLNSEASTLVEQTIPDLLFIEGSTVLQYHKEGTCGGQITLHDFSNDANTEIAVFTDRTNCDLEATAIAISDDLLFISYQLTSSNPIDNLVRIIDLNTSENSFVDITLDQKPVDLAIANNRLFVLTFDELITDENSLSVFELSNNSLIREMDLGFSVRRIFKDVSGNIIIGYDELHTMLNSQTMAFEFIRYDDETAPKFATSSSRNFDTEGKLYYPRDAGATSTYPLLPAIYDFNEKLVVVYDYENFISEQKRNFEYEIETTTAVSYDEENSLILIGYKKLESASKEGGLLRIQTAPELRLVDNIDLDGVPSEILIK